MNKIGINGSFLRKINTGIGQYTLNIVNALLNLEESENFKFFVYAEEEDNLNLIEDKPNLEKKIIQTVFYKRDDLLRKASWEKVFLPREAKKDGVDIFFTPFNSSSVFKGIQHTTTIHDMIWKVFESIYANNIRKSVYFNKTFKACQKANSIITVSEYSKKEIVKYLNIIPGNIFVVYNGINDDFKKKLGRMKQKKVLDKYNINYPYFFYMGGFEQRKNVDLLIRVFAQLKKTYSNLLQDRKLVIAGEILNIKNPLLIDIEKIIKELKMEKNVILLGKVPDEDRPALYQGAEIFIYPSLYEGFGMPITEAMASGCPVIASNTSAIPEIGRTAIEYFNPNREDELTQQIISLMSKPKKKEELSRRGIERAKNFTWEKAAEKTLKILTGTFEY